MISALTVLPAGNIRQQRQTVSAPMPPLAIGEVVEATVVAKQDGKFRIAVKGVYMEASSELPLAEGQKITVQVGRLHPQILLVPVNGEERDLQPRINDLVRNFKQEPNVLENTFASGRDMLSPARIDRCRNLMPGTDLLAIRERLLSLLFSRETLEDYAGRLGLLHERAIAEGKGGDDNLKAMLIKLQEDIEKIISRGGTIAPEVAGLQDFAASAIGRIETLQAVNLLSAAQDGLFFFPFPYLARHDEIRTGEFFASRKEAAQGRELRAVLFLDLDRLGKIMAEARLTGGAIRCAFRCEKEEARGILSEKIPLLQEGFSALGYKTNDIRCYHEKDMAAARREILEEMPAYATSTLNINV